MVERSRLRQARESSVGLFGLTDWQLAIIPMIIVLLVLSYQVHQLRQTGRPRLRTKASKALFAAEPIAVRHDRPRSLTPDGKPCWGAEEYDFQCFKALAFFPECINSVYVTASQVFRLQELSDTSISGGDSPEYGRRYAVFYNKFRVGKLELTAEDSVDESVSVRILIDRVAAPLLPYYHVHDFLETVASLVCSKAKRSKYVSNNESEYDAASSRIRDALLAVLWDMQNQNDWYPDLEVRFSGTADYYYSIAQNEIEKRQAPTSTS